MDLVLTEEQELLRRSANDYLRTRATPAHLRELFDSPEGWSRSAWREITAELGWLGAAVPSAYGGQGLGVPELVVLQQELGRALYPSPFFVMAGLVIPSLIELGTPAQCAELLPALLCGERIASMAFTNAKGLPVPHGVEVHVSPTTGKRLRLDGHAGFVLFGHCADLFFVVAQEREGISLLAVPASTPGLKLRKLKSADPARPLAALRFDGVELSTDAYIGAAGAAADGLARIMDRAAVIQAGEQVGGAQRCVETATAYACTRVQFGRPIGSFQAIKHLLADAYTACETAQSMLWYAACVAEGQEDSLPETAPVIKAYASEAFMRCAGDTIQVHGGMGYTWECDAHFYLKHARATFNFLGDPGWQREQLAHRLKVSA
jgi:alkylation response protein AidB-like acyl-CoA dehydrogenase